MAIESRVERQDLLKNFNNKVHTETGLTREELEADRDSLVAPGWTLGKLVSAVVSSGEARWEGGSLRHVPQVGVMANGIRARGMEREFEEWYLENVANKPIVK